MATAPNYSKSEWASLSIQERIRAMNKVTAGDDEISLQTSVASSNNHETTTTTPEPPPKRSSVIDMWRKREVTTSSPHPQQQQQKQQQTTTMTRPKKEKPPPGASPSPAAAAVVSVPWPDEEDDNNGNKPPAAQQSSSVGFQPKIPTKKQPAPSWRSQLKSSSRSAAAASTEEKEADLTILPSSSSADDNEIVAASSSVSHSKSVMDLWTKRALSIPDSPMTVESEPEVAVDLVDTTPKRSSVVDIWTKRTTISEVTPKRNVGATSPKTVPSKLSQTLEKNKESPLIAWNKRKSSTPQTEDTVNGVDLVVVASQESKPEVPNATASPSVVNRYSPAGGVPQLRKVPPRPAAVETRASEETVDTPTQSSSLSNRWRPHGEAIPQLRKVPRKSPSMVGAEPKVEDDEGNEEAVENTASEEIANTPKQYSGVANRWMPNGEAIPQLRKVTQKSPSTADAEHKVEEDERNGESTAEETKPTGIVNRWKPQGNETSVQLRKVPANVPSPIVPAQSEDESAAPVAAEGPKHSSVLNRWNPQLAEGSPQQRKQVPKKVSSTIASEPSTKQVDGDNETAAEVPKHPSVLNRWNPQGTEVRPSFRKTPGKLSQTSATEQSIENVNGEKESESDDPKHVSVANRWNPQGTETNTPSRCSPARLPPTLVTGPVEEDGNRDDGKAEQDTSQSSVINRWNPRGTNTNSQLRKTSTKLSSADETKPSTDNKEGDIGTTGEEPKRSIVSNRWNPQRTEDNRKERGGESCADQETRRFSVSNRWNPQRSEASQQQRSQEVTGEPKTPSVAKRWNPQGDLASPQLRKVIDRVATPVGAQPSIAVNANDDKEEVTAEELKGPVVSTRWKPTGPYEPRKVPIKAPPPIVTCPSEEDLDYKDESVTQDPENSSVAGRWNPQRKEVARTQSHSTAATTGPVGQPAKVSVLDRYKPIENGTKSLPNTSGLASEGLTSDHVEKPVQPEFRKESDAASKKPVDAVDETTSETSVSSPVTVSKPDDLPNSSHHPDVEKNTQIEGNSKDMHERCAPVVMLSEATEDATFDVAKQNTSISVEQQHQSSVTGGLHGPASIEQLSTTAQISDAEDSRPPQTKNAPPAKTSLPIPAPLEAPEAAEVEVVAAVPEIEPEEVEVVADIEPAISLPFDESPATKLFASIDMKGSESTDQGSKAEGDGIDGARANSPSLPDKSVVDKPESVCEVHVVVPPESNDSGNNKDESVGESEDKLRTVCLETKAAAPKQIQKMSQRSKARGLFASFRKHQHALKVHTSDERRAESPLLKSPIAKPAEPSNGATTSIKQEKANAADKDTFQSGTSAFTPKSESDGKAEIKPKNQAVASSTPKNPTEFSNISPGMQRNRSKRPKTMKEFLKQHRLKRTPAAYSSVSSASSVQSAEKRNGNKRTDENVKSVDDDVDTLGSSTTGTTQPRVDVAPASSSALVHNDENTHAENTDEPGRIVTNSRTKTQQTDPPDIVPSPSPRSRSLQERRIGRHRQITPKSRSGAASKQDRKGSQSLSDDNIPTASASRHSTVKPVEAKPTATNDISSRYRAVTHRDERAPVNIAARYASSTPGRVQERARAFDQRAKAPSQNQSAPSWVPEKKVQPSLQDNKRTIQPMPVSSPRHPTTSFRSSQPKTTQTPNKPIVKPSVVTQPIASDMGASDAMSYFSTASSGCSSSAFSGLSVEHNAVTSPSSSLSNRASRALTRRRRQKPTKSEEKLAAQDLARRVIGNTIKEQQSKGDDEDDASGSHHPVVHSAPATTAVAPLPLAAAGAARTTAMRARAREQARGSFGDHMMPDIPRGPGLSGRYNTSSRFVDSAVQQNVAKGAVPSNMSFGSDTTEGSSQIRSVSSTSGSEAWMSGRMNKSSASSLNRVPSDSTDGISYQSGSVMTGRSGKEGEVVTEYFVSESSSNLDALKSAYEAVSLHQLAMDLTDEVSVATKVNLRKIASDLNEGMSSASSSLRNGLSSLNGGNTTTGADSSSNNNVVNKSPPKKLKVPTSSKDYSSRSSGVDEEVAIEVEYMEDSDIEGEDGLVDSPLSKKSDDEQPPTYPAGEPSQESSDRSRRAYV